MQMEASSSLVDNSSQKENVSNCDANINRVHTVTGRTSAANPSHAVRNNTLQMAKPNEEGQGRDFEKLKKKKVGRRNGKWQFRTKLKRKLKLSDNGPDISTESPNGESGKCWQGVK